MNRPRTLACRGFVLLEVILSLLILGIAVAAFMRSFTQSLDAARRMEVSTQATSLATRLMQELDVQTPRAGLTEGVFDPPFDKYHYYVKMDYEEINYGKLDGDDEVEQFFPMRMLEITIDYDDGNRRPFQAIQLKTAIPGWEKFSFNSKQSYANF